MCSPSRASSPGPRQEVTARGLTCRLDELEIPANPAGYRQLLEWAQTQWTIDAVGVEGTGSYGAGLARFLTDADIVVIEVSRPNRQHRRRYGKSDPADAEGAASAVLSGQATALPKSRDGILESNAPCTW